MKGNCIERAGSGDRFNKCVEATQHTKKCMQLKAENEEENYSTQNNFAKKKRLLLIQPWGSFSILDSLPMQQEMQFFNEREERELNSTEEKTCLDFSSRLLLFHIHSRLVYYAFFHLEPFLCSYMFLRNI
jgi:hypothetical protein